MLPEFRISIQVENLWNREEVNINEKMSAYTMNDENVKILLAMVKRYKENKGTIPY